MSVVDARLTKCVALLVEGDGVEAVLDVITKRELEPEIYAREVQWTKVQRNAECRDDIP